MRSIAGGGPSAPRAAGAAGASGARPLPSPCARLGAAPTSVPSPVVHASKRGFVVASRATAALCPVDETGAFRPGRARAPGFCGPPSSAAVRAAGGPSSGGPCRATGSRLDSQVAHRGALGVPSLCAGPGALSPALLPRGCPARMGTMGACRAFGSGSSGSAVPLPPGPISPAPFPPPASRPNPLGALLIAIDSELATGCLNARGAAPVGTVRKGGKGHEGRRLFSFLGGARVRISFAGRRLRSPCPPSLFASLVAPLPFPRSSPLDFRSGWFPPFRVRSPFLPACHARRWRLRRRGWPPPRRRPASSTLRATFAGTTRVAFASVRSFFVSFAVASFASSRRSIRSGSARRTRADLGGGRRRLFRARAASGAACGWQRAEGAGRRETAGWLLA